MFWLLLKWSRLRRAVAVMWNNRVKPSAMVKKTRHAKRSKKISTYSKDSGRPRAPSRHSPLGVLSALGLFARPTGRWWGMLGRLRTGEADDEVSSESVGGWKICREWWPWLWMGGSAWSRSWEQ